MGSIGLGKSDVEALLAEQDWADLSRRLTLHAFKRLRRKSRDLAEEFAQTAIERVLSAKYAPWDPTREPDLFNHLGSIVNSLVANHVRSAETVATSGATRGAMREAERVADDTDTVEDRLISKDFAARAAKRLRERVRDKKDTVNMKLLELMADGVDKPQDLAEAADVTVEAIYNAKDRLRDHLAAVKIELGWEDGDGH